MKVSIMPIDRQGRAPLLDRCVTGIALPYWRATDQRTTHREELVWSLRAPACCSLLPASARRSPTVGQHTEATTLSGRAPNVAVDPAR